MGRSHGCRWFRVTPCWLVPEIAGRVSLGENTPVDGDSPDLSFCSPWLAYRPSLSSRSVPAQFPLSSRSVPAQFPLQFPLENPCVQNNIRTTVCRQPSNCSRRQKGEAQREREAEREEKKKKDKTVSAPKVGHHLCDRTLLLHQVVRARMSDTHADESTSGTSEHMSDTNADENTSPTCHKRDLDAHVQTAPLT